MYNIQDIKRTISLSSENGILLSKEFFDLLESADYASLGCQELAKECFLNVSAIFQQSFRQGITSSAKSDIQQITDLWAKLTNSKSVTKLVSYQKKMQQTMQRYKIKGDNMDIKKVVIDYIDETIRGADVIIKQLTDNKDKKVLASAQDKLKDIRAHVEGAMDGVSISANELAKKIIGAKASQNGAGYGLIGWWNSTQNKMITTANEKLLDEAFRVAQEWYNIVKTPTKKELAKEQDKVKFDANPFVSVVGHSDVKAIAQQFFKVLDEKKATFGKIDEINDEIAAIRKSNSERSAEIERWDEKVDKGECSLIEADEQIQRLEAKIDESEEEVRTKKIALSALTSQMHFSKSIIRKYALLESYYKAYEALAPKYFYDIFSNIDYNAFIAVLNGDATKEEHARTEVLLESTLFTIADITKNLESTVAGLESMLENHLPEKQNNVSKTEVDDEVKMAEQRRKERQAKRAEKQGTEQKEESSLDEIFKLKSDN